MRANANRNSHVPVRGRALDDLYCTGIIDPVADLVLIQRAIRDSRTEVIIPALQERHIHDEVNRQAVLYTGRRQPLSFKYHIGGGDVLPEPVPKHESDVWMLDVLKKFHRDPDAYPFAL